MFFFNCIVLESQRLALQPVALFVRARPLCL